MKLVAVDYGLARTGLAATDPDGILAYPLETIRLDSFPDRRTFLDALAARILRRSRTPWWWACLFSRTDRTV